MNEHRSCCLRQYETDDDLIIALSRVCVCVCVCVCHWNIFIGVGNCCCISTTETAQWRLGGLSLVSLSPAELKNQQQSMMRRDSVVQNEKNVQDNGEA